ncbi:hypothetical protein CIPAW_15G135700 [Carya illinoinensis]|uniref:Uncharacterized protein n=1 Tax=Carya illinoinensis TaxID=32201 RepID=A0A8T1NB26_CARIL|nr:hypothetical protein CIPAW_15G135700 [Carya illinoinensis]
MCIEPSQSWLGLRVTVGDKSMLKKHADCMLENFEY